MSRQRQINAFKISVLGFVIVFALVVTAPFVLAEQENNSDGKKKNSKNDQGNKGVGEGHLIVPVYPRGQEKQKATGDISDLHGMFIQLEDGSVLSAAQWILGSLKRSQAGIGMTKEEQQLFLGQVARAYAGMAGVKGTRLPVATPFASIPKPVPVTNKFKNSVATTAKSLLNLFGGDIGNETHWAVREKVEVLGPVPNTSGVMVGHFDETLSKNVAFYRTSAKFRYQLDRSKKQKNAGISISTEK